MIGPGRLVLIVGPSGAGKDTLIAGARAALGGDDLYVFPRRAVTRQASASEDHESLDEAEFEIALASGKFAFWWSAHGLRYGIPASVDGDLRVGKTVICNVSRSVIRELYKRYARVVVVMITAPDRVLTERRAARGRDGESKVESRAKRAKLLDGMFRPDFLIENVGDAADGIETLIAILRGAPMRSEFPAELLF
jgi:ribose 1,5-bisphosphokinase